MGWTYRTFHFCIERSCILLLTLTRELGASRVLSCMSNTVAVEGRSIFTGEPEYLAADTLRGLFPRTVCSEGEDIVSKPRLSYGQKVVDRTVLTSQSVPPLAPPWQPGGCEVLGGATLLPDVTLAFRGQLLGALLCAAACLGLLSQTLLSMPLMALNS